MALVTAQDLMEAAQLSGMLTPPTLDAQTKDWQAAELARQWVEQRLITSFQAEQLLAGLGGACMLAGRYCLLEKLGEGGMGTVYHGLDKQLNRPVAVKVLPDRLLSDADAIARFQREARALAQLTHPNIVQAYDSGTDQGRHFLVMEFVPGTNLSQLLKERGKVPPTQAADFGYQVALGLAHAHGKGLVHRDLKPGNLLLSKDGQVKILDLGMARFLQDQIGEPELTREGSGMGTPDYMPPEQINDARRADHRADLYSLGCTLFHLLAGRVPFPGSALSEKLRAHERQPPPPLEDLCPDIPAGLALAVHCLLEKRPADRFQTAHEVADALAPHVAGASPSAMLLKQTGVWNRSLVTLKLPGRNRPLRWAAAAMLLLGLVLIVSGLSGWWQPAGEGSSTSLASTATSPAAPQIVTIPNGLTVAKNGTGQFRTINEALKQAKPGMTLRVLDDAEYEESLTVDDPARWTGLRLEAVQAAALRLPAAAANVLVLRNVPGVQVSGFRFTAPQSTRMRSFIHVSGTASGVVLERLQMTAPVMASADMVGIHVNGIFLDKIVYHPQSPPMTITQSDCAGVVNGINILGPGHDEKETVCGGIVVRQCRLSNTNRGITVKGIFRDVHIVGNLVRECYQSGLQLESLGEGTERILLANNTVVDCEHAFRFWEPAPGFAFRPEQVEFSNNLFISPRRGDIIAVRSAHPHMETAIAMSKGWTWRGNWRELSGLTASFNMPLTEKDKRLTQLAFLCLIKDNADYLRPVKDSPLATGGVGGDLPTYVGALPPAGVPAWDWQKTWEARDPKLLLTVSKDAKDGGEFRTISEALAKVQRPGMTIRVLDDAVYEETFLLRDTQRLQGLTLEAPQAATLRFVGRPRTGMVIVDVPHVTVRGFVLEPGPATSHMVVVQGRCSGTVLENLTFRCVEHNGVALSVEAIECAMNEPPVIVQGCALTGHFGIGCQISGLKSDRRPALCQNVVFRNNRIRGAGLGLRVGGLLQHVHIVGNLSAGNAQGDLVLMDLHTASHGLLVANNTFQSRKQCMEIHSPALESKGVEIRNNLLLTETGPDIIFGGDHRAALASWTIAGNWRQVKPPAQGSPEAAEWVPGPNDTLQPRIALLSTDPAHADFLRPAKDSPLATSGMGGDLPTYVGALPPPGQSLWDWTVTWKARTTPAPKGDQGNKQGNDPFRQACSGLPILHHLATSPLPQLPLR